MQLMQAHNATSTTACWAITKTNKQTHAKEKQKKKLAHVLMGTSQPDFFFFFFVISGTHQSTQDEQYSG